MCMKEYKRKEFEQKQNERIKRLQKIHEKELNCLKEQKDRENNNCKKENNSEYSDFLEMMQ